METVLEARGLNLGYADLTVIKGLNFSVRRGEIFVVMGGSGCGKSTLLKSLIGLNPPQEGRVLYYGKDFWGSSEQEQEELMRRFGVLYQSGALWSSLTLAENVAFPLELYSGLSGEQISELVSLKLSLVGLEGFKDFYPAQLSGGMRKRAGLARALALDPDIVFFDEPSSGLDPLNAKLLDDLILELREVLGVTAVVVTHELASIFSLGDNAILLDAESKSVIAEGPPQDMLKDSQDPRVTGFLTRAEKRGAGL
jgi:phospholipid/cholesterol/gamma-HCH transport system ATP-binding protein